jgi:hypothetical protein
LPRQIFSFDPPERFVVGTVGQPGERTFFLQAKDGAARRQRRAGEGAGAGARRAAGRAARRGPPQGDRRPVVVPSELEDVRPLDQPIMEEFRVGTMALAWDTDDSVVVVEAHAATGRRPARRRPDPDPDDGPDVLRVRVSAAHGRAFVKRALRVVAAGRPPCPLCGQPLDPQGHICPRQNGHHH